jgi:hypothetical protein
VARGAAAFEEEDDKSDVPLAELPLPVEVPVLLPVAVAVTIPVAVACPADAVPVACVVESEIKIVPAQTLSGRVAVMSKSVLWIAYQLAKALSYEEIALLTSAGSE